MSITQADLTNLINSMASSVADFKSAVDNFKSISPPTNQGSPNQDPNPSSPPPPPPTPAVDTAAAAELVNQQEQMQESTESFVANTGTMLDQIGMIMAQVAGAMSTALDGINKTDESLMSMTKASIDYLNEIQGSFGGMFGAQKNVIASNVRDIQASNIQLYTTYGNQLRDVDRSLTVMFDGTRRSILDATFESSEELSRYQADFLESFAGTYTDALGKLEESDTQRAMAIGKAEGLTAEQTTRMMQRHFARTGEMSEKHVLDMAAFAHGTADSIGLNGKVLLEQMVALEDQTRIFANEGPKELAKISAAMQKLNVDVQDVGQTISKFMSFESAVSSISDLTTVFGVQMDAMEMTMLANEDRTEFLSRMRESILDAGVDIENMSQAQKNLIADSLSMDVETVENFLRTGQEMGLDQIQAAQEKVDPEADFNNIINNAERAQKSLQQMQKESAEAMQVQFAEDYARMGAEFEGIKTLAIGAFNEITEGARTAMHEGTISIMSNFMDAELPEKLSSALEGAADAIEAFRELSPEDTLAAGKGLVSGVATGFEAEAPQMIDVITSTLNDGYLRSDLASRSPSKAAMNATRGFDADANPELKSRIDDVFGRFGTHASLAIMNEIMSGFQIDESAATTFSEKLSQATGQAMKEVAGKSVADVEVAGKEISMSSEGILDILKTQVSDNDEQHKEIIKKHEETITHLKAMIDTLIPMKDKLTQEAQPIVVKTILDGRVLFESMKNVRTVGGQSMVVTTDGVAD